MRRAFLLRPLVILAAVFFVALSTVAVPAASAAVQNRIGAAITNNSPVEIPNSVHPLAKLAKDLGPTPADTRLGMSLRFSMTDAQSAALDQLLADQQNPASPRYHQWLSPTQFGAQFGLSSADIAKVTAWLTAQGFTVTGVANSGTFVAFSGTVAQAQTAFATSIHNVSSGGETHFANITNASVPGALAGVVGDITGLHNFRLKPHLRASVVKPDYTSSISGDHFLAPGDIYTIYQVNPLLNANPSINGTGETIAVTGQVDINTADVLAFRSASGLSTTNLPTTVHGGCDPGTPTAPITSCVGPFPPSNSDLEESSLDVEWSGAMAPSATILFVSSECVLPGTGCGVDSMTWAIAGANGLGGNLAPIVTTSYGDCEASWGSNDLTTTNTLFKQANAQGQTVLAAAGDEGATDCDAGPLAIEGQTVDFPASSPYVTGMGGTMFTDGTATGATTYWSGTNGATGGSATMYIPEAVWNDASFDFFGGGGGGASAFFTKPTWQVGTGVPADGARDVPDLSLDASDNQDPYLFCVSGFCTNGFRNSSSSLNVAGGTSFDSQIMGGLLALVEQKIGARIGNANPVIYALANSANAGVVFNDIVNGNNAMACTAGTANCLNGGSTGFSAASGYDLATGWGSVNVSNMATAWTKVTALGTGSLGTNASATSLTASPISAASGAMVTLTAIVTGAAGTPTGTVQFLANNVAQGSPVAVVALNSTTATATYQWTTSCAAFGQQSMSASYSGDTTYQGSRGPALVPGGSSQTSNGSFITAPVLVTVSGTCPDFSLTASSSLVTVAAGGTIPAVTVSVAPANGFTGTVVFTLAAGSTTSGLAPIVTFSPGSVTVTSTSSQTTSVTLTGITADLKMPAIPGNGGLDRPWYAAGSGAAVACLLLLTLPRKRRLGGLLLVALSIALIGGATGCGGGSSSTVTPTPPTSADAGTYTETVVGTYTSSSGQVTTHSTTITYIIN